MFEGSYQHNHGLLMFVILYVCWGNWTTERCCVFFQRNVFMNMMFTRAAVSLAKAPTESDQPNSWTGCGDTGGSNQSLGKSGQCRSGGDGATGCLNRCQCGFRCVCVCGLVCSQDLVIIMGIEGYLAPIHPPGKKRPNSGTSRVNNPLILP